MGAIEAIGVSKRLCNRGDLAAAARVLDPYTGDRRVDLQRASVAAEAVLLDGLDPVEVERILTPHLDEGRSLDLIGIGHFHSAITTGAHGLSEAIGECTAANRLRFDVACWKATNVLHIGMIQQAFGSHDIAEMYLRDAYRQTGDCPSSRASAALHLGLDQLGRSGPQPAVALVEEALDIRRENSMDARVPETLVILGDVLEESEPDQSTKLVDEAVALARELRVRRPLAVALTARGRLLRTRQDLEEAHAITERLEDRKLAATISSTLARLRET